jgi:hypothetical protein
MHHPQNWVFYPAENVIKMSVKTKDNLCNEIIPTEKYNGSKNRSIIRALSYCGV